MNRILALDGCRRQGEKVESEGARLRRTLTVDFIISLDGFGAAVITGATGTDRIFDDYPDLSHELVDSRLFDGRLQLLEYVPTVLDGPP